MSITGKDLTNLGFPEGKAFGLALEVMQRGYSHLTEVEQLALLDQVMKNPLAFENDEHLHLVVGELLGPVDNTIALVDHSRAYSIYGADGIEQGALRQMEIAMKLPVTVAGALMPDAHQGYGLPIGGVLATRNAVIPYGVGVDIGCRMCMTLYNLPVNILDEKKDALKKLLLNNTMFGTATFKKPKDHEVLERKEFSEIKIVREMKDRAAKQIGSSGGGNHFVEFGVVEVLTPINEFNLAPGQYVAVLSHSGSRGPWC